MLFNSLHVPFAYQPDEGAGRNRSYFALLEVILQDTFDRGVILVDHRGCLISALKKTAAGSPRILRLIEDLDKAQRIVTIPVAPSGPFLSCGKDLACQYVFAIAQQEAPVDLLLADDRCCKCTALTYAVSPCSYPHGAGPRSGRRLGSFWLAPAQWNDEQFENEVLRPLLRYAKHVKVIDRYIGRSIISEKGQFRIDPNYEYDLLWLYQLFVRLATGRGSAGSFEVICGVRPKDVVGRYAEAAIALMRWATKQSCSSCPLSMVVKVERGENELPHDRFLITDQAAILIGRGCDMHDLSRDGVKRELRDVSVSLTDPGELEMRIRQVDDALAEPKAMRQPAHRPPLHKPL